MSSSDRERGEGFQRSGSLAVAVAVVSAVEKAASERVGGFHLSGLTAVAVASAGAVVEVPTSTFSFTPGPAGGYPSTAATLAGVRPGAPAGAATMTTDMPATESTEPTGHGDPQPLSRATRLARLAKLVATTLAALVAVAKALGWL